MNATSTSPLIGAHKRVFRLCWFHHHSGYDKGYITTEETDRGRRRLDRRAPTEAPVSPIYDLRQLGLQNSGAGLDSGASGSIVLHDFTPKFDGGNHPDSLSNLIGCLKSHAREPRPHFEGR
jgi:hypothetical protein